MAIIVVYNGYTLPNVRGPFSFNRSYTNLSFSCNFIIEKDTSADLEAECSTAEEKLSERYKDLTVNFSGTPEHSISHSGKSALLVEPSITKVPNHRATETSREYSFSVKAQLPATKTGDDFRREAKFTITKGANSKQMVKFNLLYTASEVPLKTSLENFNDHAETYCNGIVSSLTGTFQRTVFLSETEQEEHLTNGVIEFEQVVHDEAEQTFNVTALKNVVADYFVERMQNVGLPILGDFFSDRRIKVHINYSAVIDREATGFSTSDKIQPLYEETIKPWIIKNSFTILGLESLEQAGSVFIIDEDVFHVDPYNYSIRAKISYWAPELISGIVMLKETIEITTQSGIVYRKLWDGLPNTYAFWDMGQEETMTRKVTTIKYDALPQPLPPLNGNNILLSSYESFSSQRLGVGTRDDSAAQRDLFAHTAIQEYLIVENPEALENARDIRDREGLG